ncbi:MAG: RNA polymerase sigma factor [Flammeovirgaceae bacterium]
MQKQSATDADLLARYQQTGDLRHWSELFQRYTSLLYGVCLKYLKDRDDAKDAVMQLFEKLAGTLQDHQVENFKSWLYVTARNHCLMHLRSKKSKKTEGMSGQFMESEQLLHLEDEPEMEQNLTKLENCIAELAAEQQKCVRLFYLDEKCYKEVADATGFDMNQVKSYIQNGKRNLKICMERNA